MFRRILILAGTIGMIAGMLWGQTREEYIIQYDDGNPYYYSGRPRPGDTCGVWFEPPEECQILSGQFQFNDNMGGDALVYIWDIVDGFDPDNYFDSDEPNASPGPTPLGAVLAGPIPYTFNNSGEWQEIVFDDYGYPPEELNVGLDYFFIGYVLVGGGIQPYYPSILGDAGDERPYHSLAWLTNPGGLYPNQSGWWAYGIDWMLRAKVNLYQGPPPQTITLTPYNPPIIIPANGGSFEYLILATNSIPQMVHLDFWCDVTLPNGNPYGPLVGPNYFGFPGNITIGRDRTQLVPANAPAGIYSYNGYIGTHPDSIIDSDAFSFEKLAVADGGGWIEDWLNNGDPFDGEKNTTESIHPSYFRLHPCSPNPFNPTTTIRFDLPQAGWVRLEVFDVAGRTVDVSGSGTTPTTALIDGWREAGSHEVIFDGSHLASGVYIYQVQAGTFQASGKMVLIK